MREFTGLEMLKIDIANCYGLSKSTWDDRLNWFKSNKNNLPNLIDEAKEPLLYQKALLAYRVTMRGEPTGHNMFLDGTASGLQIMACLSGCHQTAYRVNLINSGKREDVYTSVSNQMNSLLPEHLHVTREDTKKPLMTSFYNKQSHDNFTDKQEAVFNQVLSGSFRGAIIVKNLVNAHWNKDATSHSWRLPDGHVVLVHVKEIFNVKVSLPEYDGYWFPFRYEDISCSSKGSSLLPHVIHSIDGYIMRQIVIRAAIEGFQVAHIHDAVTTHPNNMQRVRELYVEVLAEIAESDLLLDILKDISGHRLQLSKLSNNLGDKIRKSDYALS